jgi:hypothetical protein
LGGQGRSADATALLQPVNDRSTEGFDTADLKGAKALLDALAQTRRLGPRMRQLNTSQAAVGEIGAAY